MNYKKIISMSLLLFAAFTLGAVVRDITRPTPVTVTPEAVADKNTHISVMYCMIGKKRCDACKKMEAWSREAVETQFPRRYKDGEIKFNVIDTDMPQNAHYRTDFELPFKTVVVAKYVDGKVVAWQRLDDLWKPVQNSDREVGKQKFFEIIKAAVDKLSRQGNK